MRDSQDIDRCFDATFTELRNLAAIYMSRERSNHTLQPTALVNEAYLRLADRSEVQFTGRTHFVNVAAQAMRRILVDHARARNTDKRGGNWVPVTLADIGVESLPDQTTILELDRILDRFASIDERAARVVEMRVFAGLTMSEIAEVESVTRRTIQSDWRLASMWLRRELDLPDGT